MARPRQVSDEQILATTRRVVVEHGPTATVDRIARALRVSAPAVLKRFGSRDALLLAALRPPDAPDWVLKAERGPGDGPLESELHALLGPMCEFMAEMVPCMMALRLSGIPGSLEHPSPAGPERSLRAVRGWLRRAVGTGLVHATELDGVAHALVGAVQSRAIFAHLQQRSFPPAARRRYVAELSRLFSRTLQPPMTARP